MDTQQVLFDWIDENKTACRELRGNLAAEYRREKGMSPGRSMIAASDWIDANLMNPSKGGQTFDAWLNATHSGKHVGVEFTHPSDNGQVSFTIPENMTPPSVNGRNSDSFKWQNTKLFMQEMKFDVWTPLQFKDEKTAGNAASTLSTHAVRVLHSKENGWKLHCYVDRTNPCVLWVIKQKK